ncbi:MAG TPA: DUF4386 domain-containing protein [bacterium]|nr:DUF4386 domain-containing protein [bacterium]
MTRRTNARVAGAAFLLYIIIGIAMMMIAGVTTADEITQRMILMAEHAARIRINFLLTFVVIIVAVTLAITQYAITRDEDQDIARLGLAFRLAESFLGVLGMTATLSLLWLSSSDQVVTSNAAVQTFASILQKIRQWNVTIAATLFAIGSLFFCGLMLRGKMIPTMLAWLGVIASVLLIFSMPLSLAGFISSSTAQYTWIPMALFEIPLGVWLLIKGVYEKPVS